MKNLKMFAISLLAFLVMASGVHAATTCDAEKYVAGATVDGKSTCYADMTNLISAIEAEDSKVTEVVLTGKTDTSLSDELNISTELTLDLNGADLTIAESGQIVVENKGSLTIKGAGSEITSSQVATVFVVKAGGSLSLDGEKDNALVISNTATASNNGKALFDVRGGKTTELTIGENVEVSTKGVGIGVYPENGINNSGEARGVTVNANGTWETEDYVIQVYGRVTKSSNPAIINVAGGSYKSTKSFGFYASGYAEWNISAGTIEGSDAMVVRSGDINISGTAVLNGLSTSRNDLDSLHSEAATGSALRLSDDDRSPVGDTNKVMDINITGGKFTTEYDEGYALYIDDKVETAPVKIGGGEFTSGDEELAAIHVKDMAFINAHESMITGGLFNNPIVGDVKGTGGDSGVYVDAANTLTKGTEIKNENGIITVGSGSNIPNDPEKNPDDQTGNAGDQTGNTGDANTPSDGTTGRLPDEPAKTTDNILVYASLALVSALSIKFTNKKRA